LVPCFLAALLSTGLLMARYYFHVRRGRVTIIDHRGVDLSDLADAAKEAARRALLIGERKADHTDGNGAIVVDDEFSTVFELPLSSL
jgi:hypothetical protein